MIVPLVVIRPILLTADSVNHRLPSGPSAIRAGPLLAVGMGNSAMPSWAHVVPWLTLPILPAVNSVIETWASGATTIPAGLLGTVGVLIKHGMPLEPTIPIRLALFVVNQSWLSSGGRMMTRGFVA